MPLKALSRPLRIDIHGPERALRIPETRQFEATVRSATKSRGCIVAEKKGRDVSRPLRLRSKEAFPGQGGPSPGPPTLS